MVDTGPVMTVAPAGDDAVLPFAVEALDIRGRAVRLGPGG